MLRISCIIYFDNSTFLYPCLNVYDRLIDKIDEYQIKVNRYQITCTQNCKTLSSSLYVQYRVHFER